MKPANTPAENHKRTTTAYLAELGIPPEVLAQKPEEVTEIRHRGAASPKFVGPGVRPDIEYLRATQADPMGLRDLIENRGFRPVEGVAYDGVASTSNEVFLGRSKSLAAELHAQEDAARAAARSRSAPNGAAPHRYGPATRVTEPD